MPVTLECNNLPVTADEASSLWDQVIEVQDFSDDVVAVKCVVEEEITRLNEEYREKESSTNVLTFSYEGEHDIALCMAVAEREARELDVDLRDYVALLLVHAFLHSAGLDHEESKESEANMHMLENKILGEAGFQEMSLI